MEHEEATREEKLLAELASKDRQIEALNAKLDHLGGALRIIDGDVARASKRFLHAEVPHGQLKFNEFLNLLELEIRTAYRKRYGRRIEEAERDEKVAISEELSRRIDDRVEKALETILPRIRGRLQDYIWIPVLVEKHQKILTPRGQAKFAQDTRESVTIYHANSLRGNIKHGEGMTPEEAWTQLRERIVLNLFGKGPAEVVSSVHMNNKGLMTAFEEAQSFKRDMIEGFRVDVRIK